MTDKDELREILNNLLANYSDLDWVDSKQESNNIEIVTYKVDQALAQIKSELQEKLPKEKNFDDLEFPLVMDYSRGVYVGSNLILSQVKQVIEEMCK